MKFILTSFVIYLSFLINVSGQEIEFRKMHFNLEDGYAIKGYDPVGYFTEGKAKKGSKDFEYNYKGIPYRFSSEANMKKFINDPEKYEPEFGGWCAYAMGNDGSKVEIDPETFKILDGKLYLFYNFFFNNTLTKWNKDEYNLKTKAYQNWNNLLEKNKLN